jgi:hypothetical protein
LINIRELKKQSETQNQKQKDSSFSLVLQAKKKGLTAIVQSESHRSVWCFKQRTADSDNRVLGGVTTCLVGATVRTVRLRQ